jgi:hypothetical protein
MTSPDDLYEYSAAILQKDFTCTLVGICFGEDDYLDARERAMGEYRAWETPHRDNVILIRRLISPWEVVDAESEQSGAGGR